ncbi:TKL protein kinase [Histomonas meleagridis]|uniref:TKL protein kinase n=1 Tax=Histomonas meleagridis TaxID=135588 RepID=UPI00355A0CEC|nr:TKL protein kinase [Histomonas meleagridis]KAH0797360.1 TKL protein kinase [Histomonas meleagridis]
MDADEPFAKENILKFVGQCNYYLNFFRNYEGDQKDKEEIIKLYRTFDPIYYTDFFSIILAAVTPFKRKNAEALAQLSLEIFTEEQRKNLAYITIHQSEFFFFCCCDFGVFTPEDAINAYHYKAGSYYSSILAPELVSVHGVDAIIKRYGLTQEQYREGSKDNFKVYRFERCYDGSDFDSAIIKDDIDTVKKLYKTDGSNQSKYSVSIGGLSSDTQSILSLAILFKSQKVIDFFFSQKVPINISNLHGWRAIHSACYNGDIELFERLYSMGETDINGCLCAACIGHSQEMVQHLISKHNMSIEGGDYLDNLSLVWYAFECRNYDIIFKINTFNPNMNNFSGFEPLFQQCAPNAQPSPILNFYRQRTIYQNQGKFYKLVGFKGKDGKEYKQVPFSGEYLITEMAKKGYRDLIMLLKLLGGELEVSNSYGRDVIINACMYGWELIISLFLGVGKSVVKTDDDELNGLYYAMKNNFLCIVAMYEQNTDLTSLMFLRAAAHNYAPDTLKFGLNILVGCDDFELSELDKYVIEAVDGNNIKSLEMLINDYGADIKKPKCVKPKVLHPVCLAAEKGYNKVLKFLLDHGANPRASYNDGITNISSFECAIKSGNKKTLRILLLRANVGMGTLNTLISICEEKKESSKSQKALKQLNEYYEIFLKDQK